MSTEHLKRRQPQVVNDVYSRASDGYKVAEAWRADLDRKGIRCPVCEALREDGIRRLDELVVQHRPAKVVMSRVSRLYRGLVMRTDLIDVIGAERLRNICHFRPVFLESGAELKDVSYLVEKRPRGCYRAHEESDIRLCKECGRLLYWPMPVDKWYVLRAYWDGSDDVTILNDNLLCTPQYYEQILSPRGFPKLTADRHPFADTPSDGLPVPYDDMVAEIRRRGWFCK